MRYLVVLEAAQPPTPPPAELMAAIMALGEEAVRSGAMIDNAGLAPSAAGARVSVTGEAGLLVSDGPFAESKEMISYALYETAGRAEAVEWTSRFMRLHAEMWPGWEGEARVLKVVGPEDFGPDATPGG